MPGQLNTQVIDLLGQSLILFCHSAPQSATALVHYNAIKAAELTITGTKITEQKKIHAGAPMSEKGSVLVSSLT